MEPEQLPRISPRQSELPQEGGLEFHATDSSPQAIHTEGQKFRETKVL